MSVDALFIVKRSEMRSPMSVMPRSGLATPHLGRRNHGLRLGLEEVRLVGSKPDDRVAYPLWRPRRHDLLARR